VSLEPNPYCTNGSPAGDACGACDGCLAEAARIRRPSRPEKGSLEYELWLCAIEVAAYPPAKRGTNVYAAHVPWDAIDRLRAALEAVGVDWERAKR
jgi:hypothetical protein